MGGAGGHMWHPFDCPDVNSGQDLIDFFRKSTEWAKTNKPALKIDGVNLSFRVRENPDMPTGYEFVVDRGSMKDLDVQGVTASNADQRFVSKDPSKPHGMVDATGILLPIFNDALPDILDELQQLGMLENFGPYSKYFNTEFVLKKINVKEYAFDFIALHSVNDFVKKGPRSRMGVETEYDQAVLDRLRDKVKPHALKKEFRVYTNITADTVRDAALEKALNEEFTIVYSSQMRDPDEPGELGIGEGSTKPIKAWLLDVVENPLKKPILISDAMIEKYPKMNKKQFAMAKNIYIEVLKGTAINEIVDSPEFVEPVVDGVVVWHATRVLGNAVLDSLESDEFGPANEQEGVVIKDSDICGGTRFKFTGDFIVGGLESTFEEQKYRTGKLLESFAHEASPVVEDLNPEVQQENKYVILLPGGFKPPTAGHYAMIKHYEEKDDVVKVFVITGPKPREGITLQQSEQIFKIYGGFSEKIEFMISEDATPLLTAYELIKNKDFVDDHPGIAFSLGAGDKGGDPKRIKDFVDYFQKRPDLTDARLASYPPAPACEVDACPASASRMRKAFRENDWELFKKLLPSENLYNDVVQVLTDQTKGDMYSDQEEINENFFSMGSLYSLVDDVLLEKKTKVSKAGQSRVSKKIGVLKKKGTPDDQAAAIAYSMEKRGDLKKGGKHSVGEQQINEADEEQLRAIISNLLQKLLPMVPELNNAQAMAQAGLELEKDIKEPIISTVMAQIDDIVNKLGGENKQAQPVLGGEQPMVAEMSGMAAGAVAGFSAPIGEEDDEEERATIAGA